MELILVVPEHSQQDSAITSELGLQTPEARQTNAKTTPGEQNGFFDSNGHYVLS